MHMLNSRPSVTIVSCKRPISCPSAHNACLQGLLSSSGHAQDLQASAAAHFADSPGSHPVVGRTVDTGEANIDGSGSSNSSTSSAGLQVQGSLVGIAGVACVAMKAGTRPAAVPDVASLLQRLQVAQVSLVRLRMPCTVCACMDCAADCEVWDSVLC